MSSASANVVLYVVNDLAYFRAHRQALASAVAKQACRVFVIAGNCSPQDARETDTFKLIAVDITRQNLDPLSDFRLAGFVRRWVKRNRPDIVHLITIKPVLFGTLGLVIPARLRGFKLVWTMPGLGKVYEPGTGFGHRLRRWLTTRSLSFTARRADASITVENEFDRNRLIDQGIATPDCVEVIEGTGLDFDHFSPPDGTKSGPLTFLMATRLLKAKGIGTYIAAARRMRADGAIARFVLAGLADPVNPDAYEEHLIERAAAEGVIDWLGPIDQSAMPDLLREVDVFCLPTQLQEGLPRSLMESAACGCALIAPDQVPVRRILVDGKTGLLIERADEDQFSAALKAATEEPEEMRRMGARAAKHIRSLPVSDADVIRKFVRLYGLGETEQ